MKAREKHELRDASLIEKVNGASHHEVESSKARGLIELLEAHRGERHVIVVQSFPDPDAISSALAHQMISSAYQIECDIAYDGCISHHENVALVELLGITMVRVSGEKDDLSIYDGSVFVDTQGTTSGLTQKLTGAGVPVVAIIDHHEVQGIIEAEWSDIRDIGATASIYAEYLESGALPMQWGDDKQARLATALMHGIRSETGGLVRARPEDLRGAAYLAQFVDQQALEMILSIARSHNAMDVIKTALDARTVRDNFSIAGIGYLRSEDRDAIPQAADFLLTEENVHTSIVYGIVTGPGERETIVGSLRTKKATFNPDTFLKEALGGDESRHFYGGGRREAGGFEIPVNFLAGKLDEDFMRCKWQLYDRQIKRRLWAKLGVQGLTADDR